MFSPKIALAVSTIALVAAPAVVAPSAASAAAPARKASIKLDQSIRGIKPGMKPAQVKARLGKPRRVKRIEGSEAVWHYAQGLRIRISPDGVGEITTSGRGDRTSTGIGVGSSQRQVRKYLRIVKHDPTGDLWYCGLEYCASRSPGEFGATNFALAKGKVTSITIARSFGL